MAGPEVHHLFHHPIADHSFSADRQTLAVARDNNVELYGRSGNKFNLQDELKGHDKTVTGVDIAPNTGRIVTCSQGKSSGIHHGLYGTDCAPNQTAMPMFGNPPPLAGSPHSFCYVSTGLLPLLDGLPRNSNSP